MNEEGFHELAAYLTEICKVENTPRHQAECNGDFTHTNRWLEEHGYSGDTAGAALDWLKARGMDCDCSVLWARLSLPDSED